MPIAKPVPRPQGREAVGPEWPGSFRVSGPFAAWAEDGLSRSGGGRAAQHALLSSAAEAAAARLIGTDGAEEVNLAKGRPQHIRKVEFAMHALPKQETWQADFAACSGDQVGIGQVRCIEMTSYSLGGDALSHIGSRRALQG